VVSSLTTEARLKLRDFDRVLELTRGEEVEAIHHGAIAIVDGHGELIARLGNSSVHLQCGVHAPMYATAASQLVATGAQPEVIHCKMRAARGRVMAKIGAAGAYAMALRPSARFPAGLGIALKIADGDGLGTVRPRVVEALLEDLGFLDDPNARRELDALTDPLVRNHRDLIVGRYRQRVSKRLVFVDGVSSGSGT
jgi:L-asparaginase II